MTILAYNGTVMGLTESLLNLGVHLIEVGGYAGMIVALILDSCGLPIPSEAVLALAGAAARDGHFNLILVIILGALAQTAGALLAYTIGRYGGEPLIKRYGKYVLISAHDYDKAYKWFEKRGDRAVFISRLIPVIRTFSGFPAGTFRMPLRRFIRDTLAGSLLWSIIFASLGYAVGEQWRNYTGPLHWLDYIVVAVVLALVIRYIYRKRKSRTIHASNSKA